MPTRSERHDSILRLANAAFYGVLKMRFRNEKYMFAMKISPNVAK